MYFGRLERDRTVDPASSFPGRFRTPVQRQANTVDGRHPKPITEAEILVGEVRRITVPVYCS